MTTTTLSVTSDDLASYMGAEVDDDRAALFLDLAMDLAGAIVSPVPAAAKAIVLKVAASGYESPTGRSQELIGPYQISGPSAGMVMSKADRAALRRLAGGGGAFSIDPLGITGTNDDDDYPSARFPDA